MCGTFAGSFGVILEKDCGQLEVADKSTKTNQIIENLFDVLENSSDGDHLISHISPYGQRTIAHYRTWLKSLKDNSVNIEMKWIDESADVRNLNINYTKTEDIISQSYDGVVKNLIFAPHINSSGLAVYARNANDGSVFNGIVDLYISAFK